MSSTVMNYIFIIVIIICGIVMYISPQIFMGRAKYDEGAIKTQGTIKRAGIAIIILHLVMLIYTIIR